MTLTKLTDDVSVISKLDDEPNDVGGLSAAELKAKFDEAGELIKKYLNESLVAELEGSSGADKIGAEPFEGVAGSTVQEQLRQIAAAVKDVVLGQIPDASITPEKLVGGTRNYYIRFEASDWTDKILRVTKSVHALPADNRVFSFTARMLVGRSAVEYEEGDVATVRDALVDAVSEAITANSETEGTYPTAEDGHIVLTWEQVQHYLLEQMLVDAETAAARAPELGFNWSERDGGVEEGVTLDELLSAAYVPALGGSGAVYDALWSLDVIRGLRLRKAVTGVTGWKAKYDLDGCMRSDTWGALESTAYLDPVTGDLVLEAQGSYAGELFVIAAP